MSTVAGAKSQAIVWLLLNSALAVVLVMRLWYGPDAKVMLSASVHTPRLDSHAVTAQPPSAPSLDRISQNALFYMARQVYVTPVSSVVTPKPDYHLTATMIASQRPPVAILSSNTSSSTRKIVPGNDLDGWTVVSVDARRVVARLNDEQIEISANSRQTTVGPNPPTYAGRSEPPNSTLDHGSGLTRVNATTSTTAPLRIKVLGSGNPRAAPASNPSLGNRPTRLFRPPSSK